MHRTDLDPLLDEAVTVARYFLEKNSEFFPFGVVLADSGAITHVEAWTGPEHPPSEEVIALLMDGFRRGAKEGEYLATALVADVRLPDRGSDAIRVTLEHRDGTSLHCFVPYRQSDHGFTYEAMFATKAEARVFPPPER